MDPFREWYRAPLSADDVLAGGLLVGLSVLCIFVYVLEIIGFRYLLSSAAADIQCMVQYGLLDGVAILFKNPLVYSKEGRSWMHFYICWVWWAYCFHLPLIAWSRLHAIFSPLSFRSQKPWQSYALCGVLTWLLSLIVCCSTNWQPWFVHLYYEPAAYGFLFEDYLKYVREGMSQMFISIHSVVVILPFAFYGLTIALLIRHRAFVSSVQPQRSSKRQNVETKLIIPCILGTIIFTIGQVAMMIGLGTGPWSTWAVCFLFFIDAAMKPLLLLACSRFVRVGVVNLIRGLNPAQKSVTSTLNSSR